MKKPKNIYYFVVDKNLIDALDYAKNEGILLETLEEVKQHKDTFIIATKKEFLKIYPSIRKNEIKLISPLYFLQEKFKILSEYLTEWLPLENMFPFKYYTKDKEKLIKMEKKILKYGGEISQNNESFALVISKVDFYENATFYNEYIKNARYIYEIDDFLQYLKRWKVGEKVRSKITDLFTLKIEDLKVDLLQYQKFEIYNERRIQRSMNVPPIYSPSFKNIFKIPYDFILYIFRFLKEKEHIRMRLLSKGFSSYDNYYWKALIELKMKRNNFILNVDLERMNHEKIHWFQFYREYVYPLFLDKKKIEEELTGGLYDFGEAASNKLSNLLKLSLFIDSVTRKKLPKGKSKFGGFPNLPRGFNWPKEMNFVAQINFSELQFRNTFISNHYGLDKGILYIFEGHDSRIFTKYYKESLDDLYEHIPDDLILDTSKYFWSPLKEMKFIESIEELSLNIRDEFVVSKQSGRLNFRPHINKSLDEMRIVPITNGFKITVESKSGFWDFNLKH